MKRKDSQTQNIKEKKNMKTKVIMKRNSCKRYLEACRQRVCRNKRVETANNG